MRSLVVTLLLAAPALGQTKKGEFVDAKFQNADGHKSPYKVFVPKGYDGKTAVPVLLFLHGSGETKGGDKQPVEVGIGTYIRAHANTFKYLTVIPQSEDRTWKADSADGKRAMDILAEVETKYTTDKDRVVLTGLSMGGGGTWSLAGAHPDRWAAIVPICSRGNVKLADKVKDIPTWAFHGAADETSPVAGAKEMIQAVKDAGGHPKFTVFPGVGHMSWDQSYGTPELWTWLAQQSRAKK